MKMNKEIVMVRLSDIIPNRFQPRLAFDEDALNELAASIKEHGIIQPLILRDLGNKYEIIAGERRYKASQLAGVVEVPAVIGQMDDQTSAELALIENIQRKDLSAIEEAKSYKKILDMGGFTQEELAKRMGKGQSTIANKMRLLTLTNEVQVALMNNLISERHARCLLQIKDEEKQKEVLNKIITERMNVRDTDNYIKKMLDLKLDEEKSSIIENRTEESVDENTHHIENNTLTDSGLKQIDKKDENPNIYMQTNNIDFIDLNNLTPKEEIKETGDEANYQGEEKIITEQPAEEIQHEVLPGMSKKLTDEAVMESKEVIKEKRNDDSMSSIMDNKENSNVNKLSKIKMATAIRLAEDTLEDIKTAGYKASLEKLDNGSSYQIIINIEK